MSQFNFNEKIDLSRPGNTSDNVRFKEEQNTWQPASDAPVTALFLIKYSGNLIKTEKQASYVLLGLIAIIIITTIFIFNTRNQSTQNIEYKPATTYGGNNLPDDFR